MAFLLDNDANPIDKYTYDVVGQLKIIDATAAVTRNSSYYGQAFLFQGREYILLKTIVRHKIGLLIAFISAGTQITLATVEGTQNLGFGFHVDVIAEPTANTSESTGHFEYLFYRKHKLSQINKCAVAPSGKAVVYQDGPSGNIFIFERKGERTMKLTSSFRGLVNKFIWHEGDNHIMAWTDVKGHGRWLKLETGAKKVRPELP